MEPFEKQIFLLADSSASEVGLMKEAFEKAGVINPVRVVSNGEEAIAYLSGVHPYQSRATHPLPLALLLDLNLAGKDGFAVLEWIRGQPSLTRLIIIVLTASNRAADADRAYELGANFYLTKPGPPNEWVEMSRCLRDWLRLNHFPTV
jgi:CheY-like chemotaxis protein